MLLNNGFSIELFKNHFPSGLADTKWIPEVASRNWIAVTGDVQTRIKKVEIETIVISNARMLHVVNGKHATHPMLAQNFVNTLEKINSFLHNNQSPCLATITRPSKKEDFFAGLSGNVNNQKKKIEEVKRSLGIT